VLSLIGELRHPRAHAVSVGDRVVEVLDLLLAALVLSKRSSSSARRAGRPAICHAAMMKRV